MKSNINSFVKIFLCIASLLPILNLCFSSIIFELEKPLNLSTIEYIQYAAFVLYIVNVIVMCYLAIKSKIIVRKKLWVFFLILIPFPVTLIFWCIKILPEKC